MTYTQEDFERDKQIALSVCKKYYRPLYKFWDDMVLFAVGRFSVIRQTEKFREGLKNYPYFNCAFGEIRFLMKTYIKKYQKEIFHKDVLSLDYEDSDGMSFYDVLPDVSLDMDSGLDYQVLKSSLLDMVDKCYKPYQKTAKKIVNMVIEGIPPREVKNILDVSRQRVHQALGKYRQYVLENIRSYDIDLSDYGIDEKRVKATIEK